MFFRKSRKSRKSAPLSANLECSIRTSGMIYAVCVAVARRALEFVGTEYEQEALDLYECARALAAHTHTSQQAGRVARAYNELTR